jgi:hypothetical protein
MTERKECNNQTGKIEKERHHFLVERVTGLPRGGEVLRCYTETRVWCFAIGSAGKETSGTEGILSWDKRRGREHVLGETFVWTEQVC